MTFARDFSRRRLSLLALLAATVLSLVACSSTSSHTQVATSGCNENVVLFGCGTFASVSAADGGADVDWVADGAVTLTTELLNGRNTLVVLTPCNALTIPMDVTADYLTPVEIAGTLRGCDGELSAQQRWVEELFSGVVSWSKDGNELTLIRDDRSMTLASS